MVQRHLTLWLFLLSVLMFAGTVYYTQREPTGRVNWLRQAMPGKLSAAHAPLTGACTACHDAGTGVSAAKCVACHGRNEALLARQPTSFHATVGNCAACHPEHRGLGADLRRMDHAVLARIGSERVPEVKRWLEHLPEPTPLAQRLRLSNPEASLDCATCHSTKDRHFGLFGTDCAACHATGAWTVTNFQHPSVRSTDCAQCHQAPPSHYMGHFEMVSKTVAAQGSSMAGCCGGVLVNQCYACHQTTSWNDIKGLGFYKHH